MKRVLGFALCAMLLSSCSGGGGGTGAVPRAPSPPSSGTAPMQYSAPEPAETIFLLYHDPSYVPQIQEFPTDATDSGAPQASTIITDASGNMAPRGLAIDAQRNLYVGYNQPANSLSALIAEYPAGSSGAVTPSRVIQGGSYFATVYSVAVGADGTIYVLGAGPQCPYPAELLVYAPGASGTATPQRIIEGPDTRLSQGVITVDAAGNVYAAGPFADVIAIFGPTANGNATPRTIEGDQTQVRAPSSLAITPANTLAVENSATQYVTEYPLTANGNIAPIGSFSSQGAGDSATFMAVDGAGDYWIYVHDPDGSGDYYHRLLEFPPNESGDRPNFMYSIDPYNPTASLQLSGLVVR